MLPKGLLKEYSALLSMMIRGVDMATVFVAGMVSYWLKFNGESITPSYLSAIFLGLFLTPMVFTFFQIYASVRGKGYFNHFINLLQAISALAMVLAGCAFLTKSGEAYSRIWFALWMVSACILLVLTRCLLLYVLHFMRARGLNERRVVIVGAGALGVRFAKTVQEAMWTGFKIVAFLDDHAERKPAMIENIPVIQTPSALGDYLKNETIDEIWLAIPMRAEARVKEILFELRHRTITTRFVLDIFQLDLLNHSITDVAGFPVLNIRTTPMSGVNRIVKAIEDRVFAAIILLLISPLLLLISIAIKLTSTGPVFFKQNRLGWDGRIINVYKFRTMYVHEEKDGQITQATTNDKRVTPLGRILRRTSLDELPQFINVLQGRMSIVGPRPHALAHNEQFKESVQAYMQRHNVKPGITGWAQVNGWRGETDTLNKMQKRVELDLYYINNWSLGFDVRIILLTLIRGFVNRNAY